MTDALIIAYEVRWKRTDEGELKSIRRSNFLVIRDDSTTSVGQRTRRKWQRTVERLVKALLSPSLQSSVHFEGCNQLPPSRDWKRANFEADCSHGMYACADLQR